MGGVDRRNGRTVRPVVQVHAPGYLPENPFERGFPPRLIIVHRHHLTAIDTQRLRDYRGLTPARGVPPSLILCTSPLVRYEETERIAALVDFLVSEAEAPDVLPRHVATLVAGREKRQFPPGVEKISIEVAGTNRDLCQSVVAACEAAGYRTVEVGDLETAAVADAAIQPAVPPRHGVLTVWDVPVLEPNWPERLRQRAKPGAPVLALIGFADRESVTLAKASGACACLDLPYQVDDLIDVIDRTASVLSVQPEAPPSRAEPPHRIPPPPKHRRNVAAEPAAHAQTWSDRTRESKVK